MDFADKAQALTENHFEQSLRRRTTLAMPFSGACLSCGEVFEGQRRFCDSECCADREREQKRKFANFGAIQPT